jgi:hypothetical protein
VSNLLDGRNCTCDDFSAWMAPYTKGKRHIVCVEFDDEISLSLIRIWNYNKSRIHSTRGAREVELRLDGRLVFRGEVSNNPTNPCNPNNPTNSNNPHRWRRRLATYSKPRTVPKTSSSHVARLCWTD